MNSAHLRSPLVLIICSLGIFVTIGDDWSISSLSRAMAPSTCLLAAHPDSTGSNFAMPTAFLSRHGYQLSEPCASWYQSWKVKRRTPLDMGTTRSIDHRRNGRVGVDDYTNSYTITRGAAKIRVSTA
ncbi:uncharacterized protein EV420DRAFT_1030150 [Desarmillaria tabescens]|uniref:Uncharacterized protein n=1 Tax=Armillaria tabescens TaxID=1929756 RepID=A0AA39JK46_ARMTA|nr:uncharacterized protein EV420DRAFT_1030150 [Desarmillaria tabescens]KAK0443400.1 hypothetical protein EV420DRAFT_1030150 [Desarmillaria tabescens]